MSPALVITLVIGSFLIIGAANDRRSPSNTDFFLMNRKASIDQFLNSNIGFSLQVAITTYFIYWGYSYGWSNLTFIITWGIGFYLFSLWTPKIAFLLTNHSTYFRALGSESNNHFRFIAIFLFGLNLIGTVYAELFFAAKYLGDVFHSDIALFKDNTPWVWLSFVFLTLIVLFYVGLGGAKKVVVTDGIQLIIAYLAAGVFFFTLAPYISSATSASQFLWVYWPLIIIFFLLSFSPRLISLLTGGQSAPNSTLATLQSLAALASAILMLGAIWFYLPNEPQSHPNFPKSIDAMFRVSYGIWPIIGFSIANLIWQFSDYTTYHRLSLLDMSGGTANFEKRIKTAILLSMINSPLTWGIGIFAGMAIDASGLVPDPKQNPYTEFVGHMIALSASGDLFANLSLTALAALLFAALLSTVDGCFLSIGQMILRDFPRTESSTALRLGILATIAIGVIALFSVQVAFQIDVFELLSTVYAWGLIFGPVFFYRLTVNRYNSNVAVVALCAGAIVGTVGSTNPLDLPFLISVVAPATSAVLVTSMTLVLGHFAVEFRENRRSA